jgi:hypothetical protein
VATHYVWSGATGAGNGDNWANAYTSVAACIAGEDIAGGDIIKVHKTHSNSAGASITWNLPETGTGFVAIVCVDKDANDALATGAVESTGGNFAFGCSGFLFVHGLTLQAGSGVSQSGALLNVNSGSAEGHVILSACTLYLNTTNSTPRIFLIGAATTTSDVQRRVDLYNCIFKFASTSGGVECSGLVNAFNCTCDGAGSAPASLWKPGEVPANAMLVGCDFTHPSAVVSVSADDTGSCFRFINCVIGTPTTGSHPGPGGPEVEFIACAAADGTNGADVLAYYKEDAYGVVEDDQSVYLTSGGSQGTQDDGTATNYSLKMTPSAEAVVYSPLYTPWMTVKVAGTGSKTISVKVAHTESAVLKDTEIWMELAYMGGAGNTANSPQAQLEVDAPIGASTIYRDVLAAGSNRADTGEGWTGIVSEKSHTLAKTVTIDEQGYVMVRVALAKDTTNPVYVDGKIGVA